MLTWPLARALLQPQAICLLQCPWATRWVALGNDWGRESFWPPVGNQSPSQQDLHRMLGQYLAYNFLYYTQLYYPLIKGQSHSMVFMSAHMNHHQHLAVLCKIPGNFPEIRYVEQVIIRRVQMNAMLLCSATRTPFYKVLEVVWSQPMPLNQVTFGREARDHDDLCWGSFAAVIVLGYVLL